jgi:uncharacterized membrane protein
MLGLGFAAFLSVLCTRLFKIHGAVMPNSESLLYAGYETLNLTRIFMASVFVGASGSVMDLAVDITSAVHEVVQKVPRHLPKGGGKNPACGLRAPPWGR